MKTTKLFLIVVALASIGFAQSVAPSIPSVTGLINSAGSTCARLVIDSSNSGPTNCVSQQLPSAAGTASIVLSGTFNATIQFEVSADNGNTWISAASSSSTTGTTTFLVSGFNGVRARASAYTSGIVTVTITTSSGGNGTAGANSYTVATLPANPALGTLAQVTDAASQGSCTTGGGSQLSLCRWTGSGTGWKPIGDGGATNATASYAQEGYLSWGPGTITAQTCTSNTIIVPGARQTSDSVTPIWPAMPAGTDPAMWISGADVVTVQLCNPTASSIVFSGSFTFGAVVSVKSGNGLSTNASATLPTGGILAQYDMLTTSAGPVLTDLSGSGNNSGAITGTTTNSQGRIFNGTSDWIAMSQLVNNSDFTACWLSTTTNTGTALWGESNATASQFVRVSTTSSSNSLSGSTTSISLPASRFPSKSPDWDGYCVARTRNQLDGIEFSRFTAVASEASTNIGTVTVTGGGAGIGALNEGSSRVNFWAGTIGYFVLYSRSLTLFEQQAVYNYMAGQVLSRPIFLHPIANTFAASSNVPVWQRQGTLLGITGHTFSEPMGMYDSVNCPTLGSTPCVRVWFSLDGAGIGELETADGVTNVKAHGGAVPTAVLSGPVQPAVVKVGSTYHLYGVNQPNGTHIDHYTSSDGNTWTLSQASVITTGSAGSIDVTALANPSVLYNPDGSGLWYMTYGCEGIWNGAGPTYRTCGATTSDVNGNTGWTKVAANPLLGHSDVPTWLNSTSDESFGNPDLHYINGNWYEWDGSFTIFRFASKTFNDLWVWSQSHPSIRQNSADESAQISDPSMVDCFATLGKTFFYYDAYSLNSTGAGVLKVATAPLPLSSIVTTSEGTTSDWP
jgi:hypothetical protein